MSRTTAAFHPAGFRLPGAWVVGTVVDSFAAASVAAAAPSAAVAAFSAFAAFTGVRI